MDYSKLQEKIEYKFNNEKLLINALTHSSYTAEHGKDYSSNNERLEFIGDAYLDSIIGNKLYDIMKDATEGVLSRSRADIVCEDTIADIAVDINLGDYLLLGKGEEKSGGRSKPSILSDATEAMIGAIIVDGGYDEGKRVVLNLFSEKIRLAVKGKLNKDYKSKLQEILQHKYHTIKIEYVLVNEKGPDHNKSFEVEVVVKGEVLGRGQGKRKAKAEQAAACDVLTKGVI